MNLYAELTAASAPAFEPPAEARFAYRRRQPGPFAPAIWSVHAEDGREIDRFEAFNEVAEVTFAEAEVEVISAARLLALPRG